MNITNRELMPEREAQRIHSYKRPATELRKQKDDI